MAISRADRAHLHQLRVAITAGACPSSTPAVERRRPRLAAEDYAARHSIEHTLDRKADLRRLAPVRPDAAQRYEQLLRLRARRAARGRGGARDHGRRPRAPGVPHRGARGDPAAGDRGGVVRLAAARVADDRGALSRRTSNRRAPSRRRYTSRMPRLRARPTRPRSAPPGAEPRTKFALYSAHATAVDLCLFAARRPTP